MTQEEVYTQFVAPFTAQFLAGYNVTLFAYDEAAQMVEYVLEATGII